MCHSPIQWLGLHLPCIDSHAVDLAKRDSLFISSAKARNIKMARWILSLQTCRSCPCPVCVYAPTSKHTHTHTHTPTHRVELFCFIHSLGRTGISQIHLHFRKSNVQPTRLLCKEASARSCYLTPKMEYVDGSFIWAIST